MAKATCCSSKRVSESDFERGTVVGARWPAGLSVCQSASDLLGFSYWHRHLPGFYRKRSSVGQKIPSERQLRAEKCVDVRGQRNLVRLVGDHGQATVTHITTG